MSNLRNSQLLQQVQAHPLKATLAKCLDIAEQFQGDCEFLQLDKRLSDVGRQDAMQSKLRAAVRDLRDARVPLNDLQSKLDQKKRKVAMPAFDPGDVVGFLRRAELRSVLRSMNADQRAMHLNDPAFADAMLELPPLASGLFLAEDFKGTIPPDIQRDRDVVAAAREKRLAGLFARELEEIAALEDMLAEARSIADIARNDLQLHSGMERPAFNEFVKPVEAKQNAPWLRRDKNADGDEVVLVIDVENHRGRIATEDEKRDGVYFKDYAEYQAARAA